MNGAFWWGAVPFDRDILVNFYHKNFVNFELINVCKLMFPARCDWLVLEDWTWLARRLSVRAPSRRHQYENPSVLFQISSFKNYILLLKHSIVITLALTRCFSALLILQHLPQIHWSPPSFGPSCFQNCILLLQYILRIIFKKKGFRGCKTKVRQSI